MVFEAADFAWQITVILIECTNNITYMLPLTVTILIAKATGVFVVPNPRGDAGGAGDMFNLGLYDIYLKLGQRSPVLVWLVVPKC